MLRNTSLSWLLCLAIACSDDAQAPGGPKPGDDDSPPPPIDNPLRIERNVTVDGMVSERFTWIDRAGKSRVAVLAHNDGQTGPNGSRGGELRMLSYDVDGQLRTAKADSTAGAAGFGYAVSHRGEGTSGIAGDDSPLGHAFSGTFERVFEGRHHVILRFRQTYPRYAATYAAAPNKRYDVPVIIDWVFSNGRSYPVWSITWDLSGVPVDALQDDSRAPYGELLFDGSTSADAHSVIAGLAWSDSYLFRTTTAPATLSSEWTYNTPHDVPFVKLWTTAVDATMGTVLTAPITVQDAGGADLGAYYPGNVPSDLWGKTSADRNGCTLEGQLQKMPCVDLWPYQLINYSFNYDPSAQTNNTRLAWRTNFGFLGGSAYDRHASALAGVGWPKQSYSTYIVLGKHSLGPVENMVNQVQAFASVTATATVGAVATAGPPGIARDDESTAYIPAGYDRVYSALAFVADDESVLDANIAVGVGPLSHPMLIIRNYTAETYPAISLNGTALIADNEFYASRRADKSELWVTFHKDFAGPTNRVVVLPAD